jgi:acetyltransferase-like isoleucine patch superfamily enzyme
MKLIGLLFLIVDKVYDRVMMYFTRHIFAQCGKNVIFFPTRSHFQYERISLGNNVSIAKGVSLIASNSHITIGDNTIINSNVIIRGGNHSSHIIGKFMRDYHQNNKLPTDDKAVNIDEDVLVGASVIILKGAHIGRGAIIKPGTIIENDVPPYSIVGGNPSKIIKYQWSTKDILRHEELAYSFENRLSIELIEAQKIRYPSNPLVHV